MALNIIRNITQRILGTGQDQFITGGYEKENKGGNEETNDSSSEPNNESKIKSKINPSVLIISSVVLLGVLIMLYFYSLTIKYKKRVNGVNA